MTSCCDPVPAGSPAEAGSKWSQSGDQGGAEGIVLQAVNKAALVGCCISALHNVSTHTVMHLDTHTVHTCENTHTNTQTCTWTHVHTCENTHTNTHTHTREYTHTHRQTRTHTNTQTQTHRSSRNTTGSAQSKSSESCTPLNTHAHPERELKNPEQASAHASKAQKQTHSPPHTFWHTCDRELSISTEQADQQLSSCVVHCCV